MTEKTRRHLWNRIHAHTERSLFDYCDHGDGADTYRAVKSANRLVDLIEDIIQHETLEAHLAGYAEGRKAAE